MIKQSSREMYFHYVNWIQGNKQLLEWIYSPQFYSCVRTQLTAFKRLMEIVNVKCVNCVIRYSIRLIVHCSGSVNDCCIVKTVRRCVSVKTQLLDSWSLFQWFIEAIFKTAAQQTWWEGTKHKICYKYLCVVVKQRN